MKPTMKNAPAGAEAGKSVCTSGSAASLSPTTKEFNSEGFHGASPEAWNHFDLVLELGDDLLPVVSDPTAEISPKSKMKGLGKIPSLFDQQRKATGIKDWTKKVTTQAEIIKWSKDNRLGICLQTRVARAIDVDISEFEEAVDVETFIDDHLGFKLPIRRRSNSTKFLMLFKLPGDMPKRKFSTKTEGNFIEFLATGQQCIVQGRHTSGSRYEFDGGLPDKIPALTLEQFETLWAGLNARFGSEESVTARAGVSPTTRRKLEDANDPMVSYLEEKWTVFDISDDGRIDILCPFADGHTDGLSEGSSTSYYPAGVGGIAQGHFHCLHTSCAHRTDQDYKIGVGHAVDGFDVIEAPQALPAFTRVDSGRDAGKIEATRSNLAAAIERPDICGYHMRYDTHATSLSVRRTRISSRAT